MKHTTMAAVVGLGLVLGASSVVSAAETWRVGTPVPPRNIMATFINQVIDGVAERVPDVVKIEYHHDFNEQAMTDQLIRGRLQMAYMSATGVSVGFPELAVLNTPFLWDSPEQRDYVTDKYVEPLLAEIFAEKGVELVRIGEAGWTSVYCKTADCVEAETFQGMKARVSPHAASRVFWEALGTNGVALPLPDTWPALQTGVVDTGDLTFSYYTTTPAAQVAPHYVFTRHSHQPAFFLANSRAWQALPEEARAAIMDSMPTSEHMRRTMAEDETVSEKRFQEAGGHTYHLNDEQRQAFVDLVVPRQEELVAGYGERAQKLFAIITEGKENFAKQAE
jgi:TRAP-type transport system periplasmic protein